MVVQFRLLGLCLKCFAKNHSTLLELQCVWHYCKTREIVPCSLLTSFLSLPLTLLPSPLLILSSTHPSPSSSLPLLISSSTSSSSSPISPSFPHLPYTSIFSHIHVYKVMKTRWNIIVFGEMKGRGSQWMTTSSLKTCSNWLR